MKLFSKTLCSHFNSEYTLISWLFLRGLALIFFFAFASMAVQIKGLIGADGILPLVNRLALIDQFYSDQKFSSMPTVFWFNASDFSLELVCYLGMGAASLLLLNLLTQTSLVVCYVLYLSIVEAGQEFTHFQWDVLLLEVGFLAIFLSWGSGIIILLFRWLLARFMFIGGVVKIASGDPSWANLTALNFHYETQPIPTPAAYYFHHLPAWVNKIGVGSVFFIELVLPFFIFMPRRFRLFSCYAFIFLQSTIILTGNYTFFNLLTILLCLFLLEDKDLAKLLPNSLTSSLQQKTKKPGHIATIAAGLWASIVMIICGSQIWLYYVNMPTYNGIKYLHRTTSSYSLVNNYGPFAVMTTTRNEIIIQGSNDNQHWFDYEFKYKPGDQKGKLSWIIPHQPRLDWQMWFAALSVAKKDSWFDRFLIKLLEGSPNVLSLLAKNPFPNHPPLYVRAISYKYRFSSLQQRELQGIIWQRSNGRIYWPARMLDS